MVGATAATPGYSFVIPEQIQVNQPPMTVTVPGTSANSGTEQCANANTPLATQPAPAATLQQAETTLIVQWRQQLQTGTIGYVPDKAPMLVGLPGCFWLDGVSKNTQTTQTQTATFQNLSFSVRFRFTATLQQVDWSYGDGSPTGFGDAGTAWVYQQNQFCSNSHTYKTYTEPGQTVAVTATEEWAVSVDTWQTTTWGYQDTRWQPALSQTVNLASPPVHLTVIQEEGVLIPPPG
jgi:hypothetical protein